MKMHYVIHFWCWKSLNIYKHYAINVFDIRWGRNQNSPGECAIMNGVYGTMIVRGAQVCLVLETDTDSSQPLLFSIWATFVLNLSHFLFSFPRHFSPPHSQCIPMHWQWWLISPPHCQSTDFDRKMAESYLTDFLWELAENLRIFSENPQLISWEF